MISRSRAVTSQLRAADRVQKPGKYQWVELSTVNKDVISQQQGGAVTGPCSLEKKVWGMHSVELNIKCPTDSPRIAKALCS